MKLIINNVTCQAIIGGVDNLLPFNLLTELREYLKIGVDGAYHTDAFQEGKWDGYKYFITEKGIFPTGFLPYIVNYCTELGVVMDVVDQRPYLPKLKPNLNLIVGSNEMYDYQQNMLMSVDNYLDIGRDRIYFPRGIWDAAPNAGKTLTFMGLVNNLKDCKALILIHNSTIYKQHVKDMQQIFGKDLGRIDSTTYRIGNTVTLAMVKTLCNRMGQSMNVMKDLKSFNTLIIDESHRSSGSEYVTITTSTVNAGVRIFVSGSALDNDNPVKNMTIIGLSGKELYKITQKELVNRGISQEPVVNVHWCRTEYTGVLWTFSEEQHALIKFSMERIRLIGKLIKERKGKQILISFVEKDHGTFMLQHLAANPFLQDLEIDMVHGTDKDRERKIQDFKDCKINILISSMILKEGSNIPCVRVLIRAEGGKSKITTKQIIGRSVRNDGVYDDVEIIDFFDEGKYVSKHAKERLKTYKKEGYKVIKHYDETLERIFMS